MNRMSVLSSLRKPLLVALPAVALVGVAAGPAAVASATSASGHDRVIRGHLVESSDFGWATGYVSIDNDFTPRGGHLGSDVTTCRAANAAATKARCDAAMGLRAGLITVTFLESGAPGPIQGQVTGGSGAYRGARGTITIVEGTNSDDQPSTADWTIRLSNAAPGTVGIE